MTSPWTEPEETRGLTRGGWIGLVAVGLAAIALVGAYWLWPKTWGGVASDVIVGEWQSTDPAWHLSFRPDKTVEMIYDGNPGPETLAPAVTTPGVPVVGKYLRTGDGLYKFKLDNGKIYEATIGKYREGKDKSYKYIENRFDLTDAEGSSGVVVFERVAK